MTSPLRQKTLTHAERTRLRAEAAQEPRHDGFDSVGQGQASASPRRLLIEIESSSATGVNDANANPVQWTYQAKEVYLNTGGYGGLSEVPNGWTGTAYNFAEDGNTGTGREMNGIHVGDLNSNFTNMKFQPLVVGRHIEATLYPKADGTLQAWVDSNNAVDGACS